MNLESDKHSVWKFECAVAFLTFAHTYQSNCENTNGIHYEVETWLCSVVSSGFLINKSEQRDKVA